MPESPSFAALSLSEFGARLASDEPVPGGGSAAAVVASIAASLVAMVARLSQDRPRYAEHAALHRHAVDMADGLRRQFLSLADADATAYARYAEAARGPRQTADERSLRTEALRAAARASAEIPLETARRCRELAALITALVGRSNAAVRSDLVVAAELASAAANAAGANVRANLDATGDDAFAAACEAELDEISVAIRAETGGVQAAVGARFAGRAVG